MAKWVLPEGRKPLPDEWFRERARMQERIEDLEAKLADALEALEEIRDIAALSEGVEFYEMLASKRLKELKGEKDE